MLKLILLLCLTLCFGADVDSNPCEVGECVPFYLCANGTIITDDEGDRLLDISFSITKENNPCRGFLDICCSSEIEVASIPDNKIREQCGFRDVDEIGFKVAQDNEVEYGSGSQFPWAVAILKEERVLEKVLNDYQCGGSLIHPSVVLTVAHCVFGKVANSLKIRAGEWNAQTEDEVYPHQDRQVSKYILHEKYDNVGLFNDVALLVLAKPVDIAENVNTICLPPPNTNYDFQRCIVTAWGRDSFVEKGQHPILRGAELPVVPRGKCLKELRTTGLGSHFELNNSFICAGGERGKDTCIAKGGSPLDCPIINTSNQYHQVGIFAWGIGCSNESHGVYVDVPLFRNWVDEKLSLIP